MKRRNADQAVRIARRLIKESTEDTVSTMYGVLSPVHIEAIAFLADLVGEISQSDDAVRTVERLFERGAIRPPKEKRGEVRSKGRNSE